MNFISVLAVVVINSVCNLAIGIKHSASLSIQHKRFHPQGKSLLLASETAGSGGF